MDHKSCIRCNNFIRCKDPRKTITFYCDRYSVTKQSLAQEKALLEDFFDAPFRTSTLSLESGSPIALPGEANAGMFDVKAALEEMMAEKRMVSPDLKIPEGDFPEAPNFYTWCIGDGFLNQKPFAMQALIATQLFAEHCPLCSDMEYMEHNIKVGDSLEKFGRKIALLEHGKCPHCGATKLKLFKKGLLAPYWELALVAGQRSGKSALLGMMGSYLTHRVIKMGRPNEVLGLLKSNVLHGTFVALTFQQAQQTLYEPYYGNILDSPWFCIAEDTQISLADGTHLPIQNIQVGTSVKTLEGTDVVTQVFDNGVHACNEVILHDGSALLGTDDHLVRCLSDDGIGLVWKRIVDLTAEDFVVVDDEGCDDNSSSTRLE